MKIKRYSQLAYECGPRPTVETYRFPKAEFGPMDWDWSKGFPMPVQTVTVAGYYDVEGHEQWLEPKWQVINECRVNRVAA